MIRAEVAQSVERMPEAHGVAGSTPALGTILAMFLLCACKVYLPPCQDSSDPPVGVTVHRVVEDDDGGAHE